MTSIELTAPAKVNLFLRVLNRRKDGYHNILTVFERISLADNIRITKIPKGIIIISDKFITRDPKDNIAYKAARLILQKAKIKGGVRIKINKKTPIGAGLGGGSSDAASVLIGLDKLFRLNLRKSDLMRFGRRLGADVPFFLFNTPFAVGTQKGDNLTKIIIKRRLWHLVIYPGFKVLTKDIYKAFGSKYLTRKPGGVKIGFPLNDSMDFIDWEAMLYNDLELAVFDKKKSIGSIIERLASSLGKKAIISGSGPSVFCLYKTRKEALEARKKLYASVPAKERRAWQVFIAETKA